MIDVKAPLKELVRLPFMPEKYNNLLGTDVSREEMLEIFKKIEVAYDERQTN